MLSELFELDLRHRHERIYFVLGAIEVLNAKRIDGNYFDTSLVADLQDLMVTLAEGGKDVGRLPYPRQRLETQVVPFYRLNVVVARKPPVAVHDKRDMLRDRSLLKGADEELSELSDSPCDWRRGCEPLVYAGVVEGAHGRKC